MSLSLPGKRKTTSTLTTINKKDNSIDGKWIRHRERMKRVRTFNNKFKILPTFNALDNTNTLQTLINAKEVCCFNENSWHHHNIAEISKFTIQKNGKKILAFSTNENKNVGFMCKINSTTNLEGLMKIILSTKFPANEKEKFLILLSCRHLPVARQIKPILDNSFFFNRYYQIVESGHCLFEL